MIIQYALYYDAYRDNVYRDIIICIYVTCYEKIERFEGKNEST
jgi:hypothetical protein